MLLTSFHQARRRPARRAVRPSLATVLVTVLAGTLLITGCTADADPDDRSAKDGDEITILQPGKPGDEPSTIGPEDVPEGADWNHPDVAFVQMMVPHHAQALEMSALARTHARSPAVKALARRIEGSQGPEILTLSAWLQTRDIEVPKKGEDAEHYDHGKHGHMEMQGMLTHEQLEALGRLHGTAFDRMFLRRMIAHHQGAVSMAQTVAVDGSDVQVSEIAADVQTGQQAEIDRMRAMLRRL
ncbi:DUF305 domain-containing protein [Nocardioides guangzhouensis]|uniref:DUF305 domain-containing protein n=1 Tax=Nocardioides guangzhouensis TaxID=2497878 RepID=A0A4Q4Z672_9ACTN|nr:DUF305 domain-containing protein [Nocardioides guangzhouensis]RYP82855.1 DUF305 domain-containing protein [Nocardioides guangzhouensis]